MSDTLTYVSFAETDRCLGVLLIKGGMETEAAANAARVMGLNPGGDVLSIIINRWDKDVPPGTFDTMLANAGRLIPPEEARHLLNARPIKEWIELGVDK